MALQVAEIGPRQVRSAVLDRREGNRLVITEGPFTYANPDWLNFETWLLERMPLHDGVDRICVSTPGLLDPSTGVVRTLPTARWVDRPLAAALTQTYGVPVHVLSDGEAHVHAHVGLFANPQVALAFDSAIAFGWANSEGRIVRPRPDRNFDIGEWQIPTHAENTSLWWALGDEGYADLLEQEKSEAGALRHWGFRMGRFVISLGAVLQPRTIVLSGARLTSHWQAVEPSMRAAISKHKPAWLEPPVIVQSPLGADSALYGMANYLLSIEAPPHAVAA
jgi:predicted NBD/HSP70 family sugar kinase